MTNPPIIPSEARNLHLDVPSEAAVIPSEARDLQLQSSTETKPHSGLQATIAAATALASLAVALRPGSQVAQAVNRAMPQIGVSLPVLVTACGTIIAAFSHPPRWRK
jgi:hypothetical protein